MCEYIKSPDATTLRSLDLSVRIYTSIPFSPHLHYDLHYSHRTTMNAPLYINNSKSCYLPILISRISFTNH